MRKFLITLRDKLYGSFRSKTIWFNVVVIPALSSVFDQLQANLSVLQPYLPANKLQAIAVVSIVGNIILRALTTSALEHK